MKLILNPEFDLYEKDGKSFCDSLQVAESFEKRHSDVLRDIENLHCSNKFRERNFALSSYKSEQNKKQPKYMMTKDGFTFLVMGYRGNKAAVFKEAYIDRFNQMEEFIRSLLTAKLEHPAFTEAVMSAHEEPKHYHFSTEINMINKIVLGMNAKQFKEANGIDLKEKSIRPYLSLEQIKAIEYLQRMDIGLLAAEIEYAARKEILLTKYNQKLLKLSA